MGWDAVIAKNLDFISKLGQPSANFHPDGTSIFSGADFWLIILMVIAGIIVLALLSRAIRWFQPIHARG